MSAIQNTSFEDFDPVIRIGEEPEENKTELYVETVEELQQILNVSEIEADSLLKYSYNNGTMTEETADLLFEDIEAIQNSDIVFNESDRSLRTKTKMVVQIIIICVVAPFIRSSNASRED